MRLPESASKVFKSRRFVLTLMLTLIYSKPYKGCQASRECAYIFVVVGTLPNRFSKLFACVSAGRIPQIDGQIPAQIAILKIMVLQFPFFFPTSYSLLVYGGSVVSALKKKDLRSEA
jgi:hypothetical protein